MSRIVPAFILTATLVALTAAPALASNSGHDGGEGWWGLTTDKIVTNYGFIMIAFFPLFVFSMSMLMLVLERRKERRKQADKARAGSVHWAGGW